MGGGGKRSLMPEIFKHFPEKIDTYWEPFVGGGAVFFTMADGIEKAVLSDLNEELILSYTAVKYDVESLIEMLKEHAANHKKDSYYFEVCTQSPTDRVEIAARFIYLNRTCFNGLYRVNKSGQFNVPKGKYKNPIICNETGLRAAHRVLQKAVLRVGGFEKIVKPVQSDFIYCDPPYDDCFTSYQPGGFNQADKSRLCDHAKR